MYISMTMYEIFITEARSWREGGTRALEVCVVGSGVPGAHGAPGAAVPAPAAGGARAPPAPAARRPRLRLPPKPSSRTFQINTIRKRRLHRHKHPQVYQLPRRLFMERQAATVLREHERTRRGCQGLRGWFVGVKSKSGSGYSNWQLLSLYIFSASHSNMKYNRPRKFWNSLSYYFLNF